MARGPPTPSSAAQPHRIDPAPSAFSIAAAYFSSPLGRHKEQLLGAREMAQWLGLHTVFPEDLSLILSMQITTVWNSSIRILQPLTSSHADIHTCI